MAVPELGQIRIIPDWFNYNIANGNTFSATGSLTGSTIFDMLDHRTANKTTWNYGGTNTDWVSSFSPNGASSHWTLIIDGHNLYTQSGRIGIRNGGDGQSPTEIVAGSGTITSSTFYPNDNKFFVIRNTSVQSCKGVVFYDVGGWNGDPSIGIVHLGMEFEMPTNATASLSYNTKFQNKVHTAFSGASYSTLYNTKPQRVLSASWEYINWSTGSSGIDDFTTMMNQCFGSHIPVALQLSQTGSITSDYFMFARITKWNQTQMSPNLWKVSAEFTEFI